MHRPTGKNLDIFNTHLSLPSAFRPEFWTKKQRMGFGANQLEEARALQTFVERERKCDGFVVTGDFNSLGGSPVYRYLTEDAKLADPFVTHHKFDTKQLNEFATAGFMNLRMRLDHMFSGPGIDWKGFEDTYPVHDVQSRFRGLSDHMPLIGTFEVR